MTDGVVGEDEVTDAYQLIRAARYLRVAPWDLIERRHVWIDLANATERAEHAAAARVDDLRGLD